MYRMRGTKTGLEEYLKIYVGDGVTIKGELAPFQINVNSTVGGVDTTVGGLPPYFFIVHVALGTPDPDESQKKIRAVEAVLEIEKPAHAFYVLNVTAPPFQLPIREPDGSYKPRPMIGKETLI